MNVKCLAAVNIVVSFIQMKLCLFINFSSQMSVSYLVCLNEELSFIMDGS